MNKSDRNLCGQLIADVLDKSEKSRTNVNSLILNVWYHQAKFLNGGNLDITIREFLSMAADKLAEVDYILKTRNSVCGVMGYGEAITLVGESSRKVGEGDRQTKKESRASGKSD